MDQDGGLGHSGETQVRTEEWAWDQDGGLGHSDETQVRHGWGTRTEAWGTQMRHWRGLGGGGTRTEALKL